jgi:hypothetical protein
MSKQVNKSVINVNVLPISGIAFNFMSRDALRNLAKAVGVKVGKSKAVTVSNLQAAADSGRLCVKAEITFARPPAPEDLREYPFRAVLAKAKLRNYKYSKMVIDPPVPVADGLALEDPDHADI